MNYYDMKDFNITLLKGITLDFIATKEMWNDAILALEFVSGDRRWIMRHDQDCCESVQVHDIIGNLDDAAGSPLLEVTETIASPEDGWPLDVPKPDQYESGTFTTFKLTTTKGTVTIRWLGISNGYYSESVSFGELKS